MSNIFDKLAAAQTKPELDALRLETVEAMTEAGKSGGQEAFEKVQHAFIETKNRLQRVPLKDRTW